MCYLLNRVKCVIFVESCNLVNCHLVFTWLSASLSLSVCSLLRELSTMKETQTQRPSLSESNRPIEETPCPQEFLSFWSLGLDLLDSAHFLGDLPSRTQSWKRGAAKRSSPGSTLRSIPSFYRSAPSLGVSPRGGGLGGAPARLHAADRVRGSTKH